MRRVVYVIVGIVTVNVALMVTMYVHLRQEDRCDTSARGLVIWNEERDAWITVSAPEEPSDLPPCRGLVGTDVTLLPD